MPSVLLALVGPAQSWGTSSRFSIRDAGTEPSKSGVIGLVASALGRSRSESIEDLAALRMGVRIDAEGVVQRDYQTALGAIRADGSANKDAVVSTRYFLADAAFLVALEGEQTVIEALDRALLARVGRSSSVGRPFLRRPRSRAASPTKTSRARSQRERGPPRRGGTGNRQGFASKLVKRCLSAPSSKCHLITRRSSETTSRSRSSRGGSREGPSASTRCL